jgi:protein tyrosine phosphatase
LTESQYEWERRSGRYQNIIFLSFKWSNFCPPTRSQIKEFIRACGVHKDGEKTYIHCHSGVDRTGVASMAIRIFHQAWAFDRAYAEFVREGRHFWFIWWKPFLRRAFKQGG